MLLLLPRQDGSCRHQQRCWLVACWPDAPPARACSQGELRPAPACPSCLLVCLPACSQGAVEALAREGMQLQFTEQFEPEGGEWQRGVGSRQACASSVLLFCAALHSACWLVVGSHASTMHCSSTHLLLLVN